MEDLGVGRGGHSNVRAGGEPIGRCPQTECGSQKQSQRLGHLSAPSVLHILGAIE